MEKVLAKSEWGLKRTCLSCSARFYDMQRDPIVCPNCEAEFDPLALVRPRRARAAAASQAKAKADAKAAVPEAAAETSGDEEELAEEAIDVETDDIDLGEDDEEDLIAEADAIDEDPDLSEALGNAKGEDADRET